MILFFLFLFFFSNLSNSVFGNDLKWIREESRKNNRTWGLWDAYQNHRNHVTEELIQASKQSPHPSNLVVFGAGNLNDLDLVVLQKIFSLIFLVDIDPFACQRGIDRQLELNPNLNVSRIKISAPIDLTAGAISRLDKYFKIETTSFHWNVQNSEEMQITPTEIDSVLQMLKDPPKSELLTFLDGQQADVVVLTCLLSQIQIQLSSIMNNHPKYALMLVAIRSALLQLAISILSPNGAGLLIVDMASDVMLPDLSPDLSSSQLEQLFISAIQQRIFFHGTEPRSITQALNSIGASTLSISKPWIWTIQDKYFLVYSLHFSLP